MTNMSAVAPTIGSTVWLADPNLPDIENDAIAGGMVVHVERALDDETGEIAEHYVCVRSRGRKLRWITIKSTQEFWCEQMDTSSASYLYRLICREIGAAKRGKRDHIDLLHTALLACEIANGVRGQ